MNKTTNYQLNQWDATDRIQRADFNADNSAVDTALSGLNTRVGSAESSITSLGTRVGSAESSITSLGTRMGSAEGTISWIGGRTTNLENTVSSLSSSALKIATGSYVGNNNYGEGNPVTLYFDFTPKLVFVQDVTGSGADANSTMTTRNTFVLIRPLQAFCINDCLNMVPLQWGDRSVSWYTTLSPDAQLNARNQTYIYLAIG